MNAPIRDFVARYAESGAARLHMPGHKGVGPLGCEAFDITEIAGADALYEAEGIIAESEANAAALFGTQRTCYSTEGSSQCLRAMLHLAMTAREASIPTSGPKQTSVCSNPRPVALAGRNAHRAFLTAAALDNFDVEWLWSEADVASPCACPITPGGLSRALDALDRMNRPPFCIYVTSPDYLGGTLDIAGLAEICHARNIPLLVDNAHGAYLKFLPERAHPMELGADLCCDSAHKTLPVLTGGAYLHVNNTANPAFAEGVKRALALFGSTSPSYLILQSLDCANVELAGGFPAKLAACRTRVDALKTQLAARGFEVLPSDPMKLTLRTDGLRAAAQLRAGDVEPEFVDQEHVVLMFSPSNAPEDFARIERALPAALSFASAPALSFPPPPQVMTIREAMFAPCEAVPVERTIGRVCAAPTATCPPAVAVAVPGEVVTQEIACALKQCGIRELSVVKA